MKSALFTTHADLALPLWESNVDTIYYYNDELPDTFPQFDKVYFRDPFNDTEDPTLDSRLEEITTRFFYEALSKAHPYRPGGGQKGRHIGA